MEIQDIKNKLTLATVLHHYNLKPDKQLRLKCPFHDDKTPSMQIYYKTHTAYCFSSNCKTHGKSLDVIDFILYKENLTKHEAIKKAVAILGGEKQSANLQSSNLQSSDSVERAVFLEKMFTYFKNSIHNSKPAQEYLKNRCLDFQKTEVGYNSGQFHHGTRKDEILINEALKYGLLLDLGLKARTGDIAYKPFGKLGVCFPLKNKENQIVSLYFRSTLDDKAQRHFYLKDRQGLYPSYPKLETKKLILTESIIDAASLLEQTEISSSYEILSLFGTNGFSEEHSEAIKNLTELQEIIFFLNGDEPGIKAVEKYAPMLKSEYPNLKITNVEVPQNEDVNSLLQSHDKEILSHLIETRKEYTFLFSSEEEKVKTFEDQTLEQGTIEIPNEKENLTPQVEKSTLNTNNPHNLHYTGKEADYYIKGFKCEQLDSLKVTLQTKSEQYFYSSKLDLYEHKQLETYIKLSAEKLQLKKKDVENDLHHLTNLLEHYRDKQHFEKQHKKESKIQVTNQTATKCIEFLKQENLINEFNKVIEKTGITGEETNRILLFIIASSFKMPDTLHALIQGSSGSGKTRLLKIISHLMPDEDVKRYTRVTDNSFYNQDEYFFVNKLLCFEDMDGLKEDAQLAVRELQSNEILITSTSIKDTNGSIRGGERTVRGPIASLSCTTKGETYEDNISRCFLIAVDESREQTMRIINYQNELSAGLIDKEEQKNKTIFIQNCMRLLKSYEVINPYANKIKLPEQAHKIRRLNELYQSFVKQITLLNQYQRKQDKQGRLITEKQDLQTACDILFESIVLKVDELDGPLRGFYEKLKNYVLAKGKEYEFTQREVRQFLNISKAQCSRYFYSLQGMEYIRVKFTGNQRKMCYIIDYWDNYAKLRAQIKDDINKQIELL
jgi:DNA primase